MRDFGVQFDPIKEQAKLVFRDLTFSDTIEKVPQERRLKSLSGES